MDEMVIRSHRIQTGNTDPKLTGTTTNTQVKTVTTGTKVMPPVTRPPVSGGSGESPESPESGGEGQEVPPEGFGEF